MNVDEYMNLASARMTADGSVVSRVDLPLGPSLAGYQSKFRLQWVATKLHLFTVVIPVASVTPDLLAVAEEQCVEYAKRTKGRLRGFQVGVAALPVLVSAAVAPDAAAAARERPKKRFAAITLPAVVDLAAGALHFYDGRLVWGAVYASWLRERVRALAPAAPAIP
jgi:hypothetical protein